jgi:hypothetical protein
METENPLERDINPPMNDPMPESNESLKEDMGSAKEYFPKNKKGAQDEWIAMEQQKQRAIEVLQKQQKEQEKIAKKIYK